LALLSAGRFSELSPIYYQGCLALTFALARLSCSTLVLSTPLGVTHTNFVQCCTTKVFEGWALGTVYFAMQS